MKAFIFPGQGSQHTGMGLSLYEKFPKARDMFEQANELLGFSITDVMFEGSSEELRQTRVTQPAIFLHSVITTAVLGEDFCPDMAAGHSLGELSALTACGVLRFEDGLLLVAQRASAMQKACEAKASAMAAVLGLEDTIIEEVCTATEGIIVTANYNCPGQVVISGEVEAIDKACETLLKRGARRALKLPVGGAFHSPLMSPAREQLTEAITHTDFSQPVCPIYQNVTAKAVVDPDHIKSNLTAQLTAPVRWKQSVQQMIADGATEFTEAGPGKVLQGLVKKIDRSVTVNSALE